ncbi:MULTISPECIES: LysR family transcriptional regulator [unclassified Pseudoalteromonas]|uniref:LysR family transcriptional regulator n=1 Tax=unclassified Pseudoalteromonas TaxID=194690 RepID=UPI0016022EC4|nr:MULTISPECIES: LysR family transcriptional regulator [unclassified Pseudoalteromonas]MBB1275335.1 LysR family transcriptional regulator [Pseudoalteromonas sp. SR43-3]MBB1298904.1 LysR family transcriptional regulator [Pseudoalteromonas sp. SR41-7]MBB1349808.1 LysR family transcriptional regulator [Pseudoalteromonas sp. SG45-3]MBB1359379.1 LysR family transcriptional regulator [Pseudoalteromonas sp. SG45-6]|tara:strand:- start:5318 stop:6226 length:909 start_codon:yes stop_codon:yes gene_type:complete
MRFEHLDLNLLVALDVLLEEKNITKSAKRLHLSQSAMSSILGRARAFFEDDLLVQVGKTMQPTPFALEVQVPITEVLTTIRGGIIGKRFNDPLKSERHFKIVASDYVIQVLFSSILTELATLAPLLTFEFLSPFSHEVNILTKGGADLFIAPESVMLDGYPSSLLMVDELACVVDMDNKLVAGDVISAEQVGSMGHVSVGFARTSHLSIETWLTETMGGSRKVDIITNDFSTMIYTLKGTQRVAILPKKFANIHAQKHGLKVVSFPFDTPLLVESMMWHPTLDNDPIHRWLREKVISTAQNL